MNNNANWSGYYKPTSFLGSNNNNITIDIHGSFTDNIYYTQDTLLHEMGHKFDDLIHEKSIIDWIFGSTSYTRSNSEWTDAYKKYNKVLNSINFGGYNTYPNVNEFFGDVSVAYFKNPQELKALCPEAYELMNKMLDGEYGYSYNDKIVAILNAY
jgi:Mlc titration factor MtfA (ptsG expression regulator)